ncbi:MAG: acetamidase/formamidase family protein [Pseudomonadota bacterium]
MAQHTLKASSETVHWGWFDAAIPPVLTVASGDTVVIESVSGAELNLPGEGFYVPPELYEIHKNAKRVQPGHILTGPVTVVGAEPGDVLEVRIQGVRLRQDWGFTAIKPAAGTLVHEFDNFEQITVALDADRGVGRLPFGTEVPLRPFFGVMGVAPPAGWGTVSSLPPRIHGGNLDNKELVAGTTLYLPVHVPGALFSAGDGHGAQGDGEVCVTAIETALEGTFQLTVRKDLSYTYPCAETPSHLISMGMDASLDAAAKDAVRRMVDWVSAKKSITRGEAYMLLSLAGDVRVTQLVNGEKGCHMMFPKALL